MLFLRRNAAETQSSLMPRCVSSRMLGELDLPAAPLSLTAAVDGRGLLCWAWQKLDIERPRAVQRWTGHPSRSSEWGESVIIIGEILGKTAPNGLCDHLSIQHTVFAYLLNDHHTSLLSSGRKKQTKSLHYVNSGHLRSLQVSNIVKKCCRRTAQGLPSEWKTMI